FILSYFLYMIYFWTLNSIPLIYMSVLMPVPHCLDYRSFVVSFEVGKCESSNFVLLFKDYFGYSGYNGFLYINFVYFILAKFISF
uniref:Uncharacterized protein n=1 Tax=Equus caballus TaxID=9796 RepID=A0A9L0R5K5_HORSE